MRMGLLFALVLAVLVACREDVADAPDPMPLTAEVIAHYCMMNISEHPGPKAQIFLDGLPDPIFFAQVRDAFTYIKSADQDGYIAAVYVNDMALASWETPGAENWMRADDAHYVTGSDKRGGMGAPELVPFSTVAAATDFTAEYGGQIYRMDDVPEEAFLAPVNIIFELEENG